MAAKVVLYSADYCPYCRAAKALLESKGAAFEEVNVEGDAEKRSWLVKAAGGRTTIPQIFIDGKPYGGFDDIKALDMMGQLEPLLKGAGS